MSKPDVTFVNAVTVSGFLNGNVNLMLTQFRWSPVVRDNKTVVEMQVEDVVDLRMDLHCAQEIRDALDTILQRHVKPTPPEEMN